MRALSISERRGVRERIQRFRICYGYLAVLAQGIVGFSLFHSPLETMIEACHFVPVSEIAVKVKLSNGRIIYCQLVASSEYAQQQKENCCFFSWSYD